jgi:hypothetical protein
MLASLHAARTIEPVCVEKLGLSAAGSVFSAKAKAGNDS